MKRTILLAVTASLMLIPALGFARDKTYEHASRYQLGTVDQSLNVQTGYDVTAAKTDTDAKLVGGGQGILLLYTAQGNYRVEAPVNKGRSFGAALATGMANTNRPAWAQEQAPTVHNKWFMDNVQPGTRVLFASACEKPSKKHPNDPVRCTFWFPDPDRSGHEYETIGDFTPYLAGNGSNTQKTADTLCGTGKLKPEVEAQLCTQRPASR